MVVLRNSDSELESLVEDLSKGRATGEESRRFDHRLLSIGQIFVRLVITCFVLLSDVTRCSAPSARDYNMNKIMNCVLLGLARRQFDAECFIERS